MACSKETLLTLFFNCPTSFHLFFFFFNFFSTLVAKCISSLCSNATSPRANDGYQAVSLEDLWFFTDDFLRKEEDLAADETIYDGDTLMFVRKQTTQKSDRVQAEEGRIDPLFEDADEVFVTQHSTTHSPQGSNSAHKKDCLIDDEEDSIEDGNSATTPPKEADSTEDEFHSSTQVDRNEDGFTITDATSEEESDNKEEADGGTIRTNISEDAKFFILETKKNQPEKKTEAEIIGDIFTDGSTSKSSSEWRSSINYRDSGTEDPFSSSSRRSCQNWESYTVHQKYDEEMMFFDRYSTQKLSEAESLRSIQVRPRSVSERIVLKLTTRNNPPLSKFHGNPYQDLETAYVAQICLAWEALNWNYKNLKRFKASQQDHDPGCPGRIAQQFQQFQVLLQRFIENEPYEHGRRPEVYARMRKITPKLLQVPEFLGSEDDHKKGGPNTMISSTEFLRITEEAIRTFMNFLKADKEKYSQILTDLFKRNRSRVDPILLHFMKKTNIKKKTKIKDLHRAQKCFRKKRLKPEDEMEILMSLIDLKVVSRVLKMSSISDEQLSWCEEKMSKVKVLDGKVQRDSSPLFFPTH